MKERPIAVFDSGLGGLSVLRELLRQLPHEHFLYFGDSANAPYGCRSTQEIRRLTLAHGEALLQRSKALVVACNTATSAAIDALRQAHPERIVVGIEPALKPAADRFPGGRVLVMATDATLREEKFAALTEKCGQNCHVITCPCPGLMEFVERGELEGEALQRELRRLLAGKLSPAPDAVVLGCTHYPFLKKAIRQVIGTKPLLLDGADGTTRETKRRLHEAGLLREAGSPQEAELPCEAGPLREVEPLRKAKPLREAEPLREVGSARKLCLENSLNSPEINRLAELLLSSDLENP